MAEDEKKEATAEDASTEEDRQKTATADDTKTEDDAAAEERKQESRLAYEARKAREKATELQQVVDGYKRREEEERKAKLTEEQRMREEMEMYKNKAETLEAQILKQTIAAEFKLPPSLASRLIGSDPDSLRADAEDLAKLLPKPKAGGGGTPTKDSGAQPTFKRSQLRDVEFFRANEAAIKEAAARPGGITND